MTVQARLRTLLLLLFVTSPCTTRVHKVHNVVLYPDRHAWCDVTTIQQVISYPGCQPKTIENNVCVGTCFSLSVPRTIPETPGDETLHYCDSCQSSLSKWIQVELDCPEDPNLVKLTKQVEVISNCSCSVCNKAASTPGSSTEDNDLIPKTTATRKNDVMSDEEANERRLAEEELPQQQRAMSRANASSLHALLGEMDEDDDGELGDDLDQLIYVTPGSAQHNDIISAGSGDDAPPSRWRVTDNRIDDTDTDTIRIPDDAFDDGDA